MTIYSKKALDLGHEIIDYDEDLVAQTRAIGDLLKGELAATIAASKGRGDGSTSYADIVHALGVVASNFAERLGPITTKAVQDGARFGRGR